MPFLSDPTQTLTALSRVPQQGAVNQAAVKRFVDLLEAQLSTAFSFVLSPTGGSVYIYVVGDQAKAVVRFVIAFQPPDVPAATYSFSIQMKSPTTGAWVNKVTYTQT